MRRANSEGGARGIWIALCALAWLGCRDLTRDAGFCQDCVAPRAGQTAPSPAGARATTDAVTTAAVGGAAGVSLPPTTAAGAGSGGNAGVTPEPDAGPRTAGVAAPPVVVDAGTEPAEPAEPKDAAVPQPQSTDDACHDACSSDTPSCEPILARCVQCTALDLRACSSAAPHCSPANVCVECNQHEDCGGAKRFCDPSSHSCVACLSTEPSSCQDSALPVCDEASHMCVECAGPQLGRCSASKPSCEAGACTGCKGAADCDRYAKTRVCDPITRGCVAAPAPSLRLCDVCDLLSPTAGCPADARCAPEPATGEPVCLPLASLGGCLSGPFRERTPYGTDELCSPGRELSCAALRASEQSTACTTGDASLCGIGGVCPQGVCSYICNSERGPTCSEPLTCVPISDNRGYCL